MPPVTIMECDAVLLDMDGTLVDSRELVERMWLLWAAEHGVPPDAVLAVAHGRRTLETMQLVAPELATPEEAARLDALEAEQQHEATAVLGARALLASLPARRWAVVTSAVREIALSRLASVDLPPPPVLIGAADVVNGKPAPDGYLKAAQQLGVRPQRCIVFEDTPPGVQAGLAAGARVIGLRTTFGTLDGCDALVADMRDVQAEPTGTGGIRLLVAAPRTP